MRLCPSQFKHSCCIETAIIFVCVAGQLVRYGALAAMGSPVSGVKRCRFQVFFSAGAISGFLRVRWDSGTAMNGYSSAADMIA